MKHNFDTKLRLSKESKYESLYKWSIQEISDSGESLGRDLIPWTWTQYFYSTTVEIISRVDADIFMPEPGEVARAIHRKSISCNLKSGLPNKDTHFAESTKFSMAGTSRQVEDISLTIHPATDKDPVCCKLYSSVSYNYDNDFRDYTDPDRIQFLLYLDEEAFDDMYQNVGSNPSCQLVFSAGDVDGFLSDWSPSITTDNIKVLTREAVEAAENANDDGWIRPSGHVGRYSLTYRQHAAPERQLSLDNDLNELDDEDHQKPLTSDKDKKYPTVKSLISDASKGIRMPLYFLLAIECLRFLFHR